ncbi:MAG: hypothetical protein ACJ8R9_25925 [Steroidobacteraceae bacterium]
MSILRIVEPESHVECVGRRQSNVRIEAEDLIEQNGLDTDAALVAALAQLDVRLVPRQAKATRERGIFCTVREERAVLNCEQVESQARLDAIEVENQGVIELTANDRCVRARLLVRVGSQALYKLRVGNQIEADLVLFATCGGTRGGKHAQHSRDNGNSFASGSRVRDDHEGLPLTG